MTRALLVCIAMMTAATLAAQSGGGTGTLAGRVVEANTTSVRAVARASVILDADNGREVLTTTDTEGRFRFDGLPAGRYLVRATKAGWVPTYYGSSRAGRPPGVRVAVDARTPANIEIPMARGAVLAGRIVDADGRPMARQFPWLLERRLVGDQLLLSRTRFPISVGSFERSTNDLGEFRLFGLPPGTYYLALSPNVPTNTRLSTEAEVRWAFQPPAAGGEAPAQGPIAGYARLYYPGTTDPDAAQPLVVSAGQVLDGLEFRVSYATVSRIDGAVLRPDGAPAGGARVMLEPREPRVNLEGGVRTATADPTGRFVFQNVPPDEYRLAASAANAAGAQAPRDLWAQTDVVAAGADVSGLTLSLATAAQLRGRLVFAPGSLTPPSDLSAIRLTVMGARVMAQALAGGGSFTAQHTATVDNDGAFTVVGLPPDRYLVSATWPGMQTDKGAWWLASLRVGDRDLGDRPIDVAANTVVDNVTVEFSDRMGTIEGVLLDAGGRPGPGYFVLAFPAERESWTTTSRRMRPAVRSATDGRFSIGGLPPGDYYLAVVTEVDSEEAADPRFLDTLVPQAVRIAVARSATVRQDLRIGGLSHQR